MKHPSDDGLEAQACKYDHTAEDPMLDNVSAVKRSMIIARDTKTAAMLRACKGQDALEPAPDHGEWDAALTAARNACVNLRNSDELENDDQRVGALHCALAISELKKGPRHD